MRYTPGLDIRNIDTLPKGTGCRFLVCIDGPDGELVAKAWKRRIPSVVSSIESVVDFGPIKTEKTDDELLMNCLGI